MDQAVDGDDPQHHPVAERLATPWDLDGLAVGWVSAGRVLGPCQRDPAVAAQAPQPANRAVLASVQFVLRPQLGGVGADQGMARPAAGDQLPVDLAAGARLRVSTGGALHLQS